MWCFAASANRTYAPSDPVSRPASVIDEESTAVVAALDGPAVLQCYAVGWPRPTVTWWRAERMLPMSSNQYEQRKDHSLVVRLVTVDVLGPYTCQAYNGLGRAASWSVTLQAHGTPVAGRDQPDSPYLVPAPRHPTTGDVIRLKPIVVKLTRPPPIYRTAPPPQTEVQTTQPPQQKVFTGKSQPSLSIVNTKRPLLNTTNRVFENLGSEKMRNIQSPKNVKMSAPPSEIYGQWRRCVTFITHSSWGGR